MAQFIKVALTANGDVVNIPVENNYVNKQTLESQFIGAIGLKYEINGTWLAVPMENGQYKIPNLELSVQYVVVTTSASSNIDQARQILNKPNLARDVQKYFSPSSKFNPRSGYSRDIKVNTTRKTARECWRNKKIFTKVIKVCFVDEVCMPVTFSKNLSLFEAMFSFSSNDDEDTLKTNLIEIWQNSGVATSIATSSDITFLSYTSKILSVPITTKEFQWTGESLKSNVGQGRLYVMVKSSKGVSSQNASSTVTTISSNPQSASYNEGVSSQNASSTVTTITSNPQSTSNNESDLDDFMLVRPKRKRPLRRAALRFRQTLSLPYPQRRTSNIERSDRDARESCIEIVDSEDEELQRVLDESLQEAVENKPNIPSKGIKACIKEFKGRVNMFDKQEITVKRRDVLGSVFNALRRPSFDPTCKLYVKFSGELGMDHGGPRRELFRLAIRELCMSNLFEGEAKVFSHNLQKLEAGHYGYAGQLIGISLANDGPGICLSKALFGCMTGSTTEMMDMSIVPDAESREILHELKNITTMDERDTFLADRGDWLVDQGFQGAWRLGIGESEKSKAINFLVKQQIYYRTAAEVEQFCAGLNKVCGLWDLVKKDPNS